MTLRLEWTDNANNEDAYFVERSPTGAGSWTNLTPSGLPVNTELYDDESALPGVIYDYRVNCSNGAGPSGYSNVETGQLPPAQDRVTLFQDDFSPGWQSRLPFAFLNIDPSLVITENQILNGFGAIDILWPAGSDTDTRFSSRMDLVLTGPYANGIEEGWLTVDMMFLDGFSCPRGFKGLAAYSENGEGTRSPPDPNGGWSLRHMLSNNTPDDRSPVSSHMYYYWPYDDMVRRDWLPNSPSSGIIPHDTVARIESYWRLNSNASATDGVIRQKYDVGTANAHAAPETVRQERTDMVMYFDQESYRSGALVNKLSSTFFFGGATPDWAPLADSIMRIGRIAVEVPA